MQNSFKIFVTALFIASISITLFSLPYFNNVADAQGYTYQNPAGIALSCNPTGIG